MKKLKGRCLFAQSGGPTAVINASLAGGVLQAFKENQITDVLCAINGIKGILDENIIDMSKENLEDVYHLRCTPACALGSVRYKLKDFRDDDEDYRKLLRIFKKYNIKFFFYNGGNDSMDTCMKISEYMKRANYTMRVIGIPKTIDNDLAMTDHCPGYGSAAKYIATTISEVKLDAEIYNSPLVVVVEVMGRNAGWLTAAAALAGINDCGADLVYLPEVPFSYEKFIADIKRKMIKNDGKCLVAVSEGIKFENGKYVGEDASKTDVFGHSALGGVGARLKQEIVEKLDVKCKSVELNILQRCAAHCASITDVEEAYESGRQAVICAVKGETDKMIINKRVEGSLYKVEYDTAPLSATANAEKTIPLEWITSDGTWLTEEFFEYALPLIAGDAHVRTRGGIPLYSRLKKVPFELPPETEDETEEKERKNMDNEKTLEDYDEFPEIQDEIND